jgi:hypothetical protein
MDYYWQLLVIVKLGSCVYGAITYLIVFLFFLETALAGDSFSVFSVFLATAPVRGDAFFNAQRK